jgi:Ran-binding protein 3
LPTAAVPTGKLFEFDTCSKSWKPRGDGEFHVNMDARGQTRMVMRQRGNLRLILNAKLFPQMTISHMVGALRCRPACAPAAGGPAGSRLQKKRLQCQSAPT